MIWRRAGASCCAIALFVAFVAGCGDGPGSDSPSGVGAAEAPAPVRPLRLDPEQRSRAGIEVVVARERRAQPEVTVYGRVLDPSLAVAAIANREAARAAFATARIERQRLEGLAVGDRNASAREVEVARAAAARTRADLELADAQLASLLGAAARDGVDLDDLARRLVRREAALVRLDVPAGGERPDAERGARLETVSLPGEVLDARYLGEAPDADPALPGWGGLYLVGGRIPPSGAPIAGRLRAPGPELVGVAAPSSALVQSGGDPFVFVENGSDTFERRAVVAHAQPEGDWLLTRGVAPGERLVVSGAQQLLSTERLGADESLAGD